MSNACEPRMSDSIRLEDVIQIVATRKGVTSVKVRAAWDAMIENIMFSLGCSSHVHILGFGKFFILKDKVFFTRVTGLSKRGNFINYGNPYKMFKIDNNKNENVPYIISCRYELIKYKSELVNQLNCIRLQHYESDPLQIAVLIEMNRQMVYKYKSVWVDTMGWFLTYNSPFANWYDEMYLIDANKLKNNVTCKMPKLVSWIPRLVGMLQINNIL